MIHGLICLLACSSVCMLRQIPQRLQQPGQLPHVAAAATSAAQPSGALRGWARAPSPDARRTPFGPEPRCWRCHRRCLPRCLHGGGTAGSTRGTATPEWMAEHSLQTMRMAQSRRRHPCRHAHATKPHPCRSTDRTARRACCPGASPPTPPLPRTCRLKRVLVPRVLAKQCCGATLPCQHLQQGAPTGGATPGRERGERARPTPGWQTRSSPPPPPQRLARPAAQCRRCSCGAQLCASPLSQWHADSAGPAVAPPPGPAAPPPPRWLPPSFPPAPAPPRQPRSWNS